LARHLERDGGGSLPGLPPGAAFGDSPGRFLPLSPVIGTCNPMAPPVEVWPVDGGVRAAARLGAAYVGPPGRVHGGWVAAILDQVLGFACVAAGHPAMTGTLTVTLRQATPLHDDLDIVARILEVDGRRVTARGAISAGGAVTAEAEGTFIKALAPAGAGDGPVAAK
ncbi:MAG: PaaI family thioesterase, partial [Actinomycetota bacterium]